MHNTARENILITSVGTLLGRKIAQSLIDDGFIIYGSGAKQPDETLISSPNFTVLDVDLSQPLPSHIPDFHKIIHLIQDDLSSPADSLSTITNKIINLAQESTKVFLLIDIQNSEKLATILENKLSDYIYIIAVGHTYGPGMNLLSSHNLPTASLFFENNELTNLISQAVQTDKIILNNDGLDMIYPTFVDDATKILKSIIGGNRSGKTIKSVVSSYPQNALSIAYEIQNCARSVLNKELNLYFAGPESFDSNTKAEVKLHTNQHAGTHSFQEGLKDTFTYFKSAKNIKEIRIQKQTTQNPIVLPKLYNPQKGKDEEKSNNSGLKPGIHLPMPSSIFKKFIILTIALLIMFTFRFAININSGISDLKKTSEALTTENFENAQLYSLKAYKHFSSAKKSADVLLLPVAYLTPAKNLKDGLESLRSGSNSAQNFVKGAEIFADNLKIVTSPSDESLNIEAPGAFFTKAYFDAQYASVLAENAQNLPVLGGKFKIVQSNFVQLTNASQSAREMTFAVPNIIGSSSEDKSYLIVLMNNAELRPGGGFIGNFADVKFKDGKLSDINVEDVYAIDGQLKEVINPPYPLKEKLGVTQLYLRDSNWSSDFRVNAQTLRDFYKKETGKSVDGIIALDLTLVEKLLEKLGPIELSDYDERITAQNLFEKGQYYSEIGFFPGSTQKRDFFSALTNALISKITQGLNFNRQDGKNISLAVFQTFSEGLAQKHLMASFSDPGINSLISEKGWDNPLPPPAYDPSDSSASTKDFLAITEANVGANKVNKFLKREIRYDMTIGRDADLMATLTITYKNESPADTWPGGTYVNYLRILAPLNSSLEEYREDNKKIDLEQSTRGVATPTVETTQAAELTQFAKIVEVPYNSTKSFTFKYRIHKSINLETAPIYELYVSKQPGTLSDPFTFSFNLPAYLQIESVNGGTGERGKQNSEIKSDLTTDRRLEIKISKK